MRLHYPLVRKVRNSWRALGGDEQRANLLSTRLKDDLPPAHRLHGVKVRAVAARVDRDDVLFEVERGDGPLAVLHITSSSSVPYPNEVKVSLGEVGLVAVIFVVT